MEEVYIIFKLFKEIINMKMDEGEVCCRQFFCVLS
jgi:hypothetical protein